MKRFQLEQIIFLLIILGVASWMLYETQFFSDDKAKTFPSLIAKITILIALTELATFLESSLKSLNPKTMGGKISRLLPYLIWLMAYMFLLREIGAMFATGAFVLLILLRFLFRNSSQTEQTVIPFSQTISGRIGGIFPYLVWLLGYFAVIYVIGMVAASALFVSTFLVREGKVKWYYALLAGILITVFLIQLEDVMNLKWPRSIIDPIEILGWH